jgi:hypothetical protein
MTQEWARVEQPAISSSSRDWLAYKLGAESPPFDMARPASLLFLTATEKRNKLLFKERKRKNQLIYFLLAPKFNIVRRLHSALCLNGTKRSWCFFMYKADRFTIRDYI